MTGLRSRSDLNGSTAMLTSKVLNNGRHEAFVLLEDRGTAPPEGINVFETNFTVNTSDARGRASAWNELGSRFVALEKFTNALDAFECALGVASAEPSECRIEGCDALALMVWMGLRMNNQGIDFEGKRSVSSMVEFGLKNIFAEVLENESVVPDPSKINLGAGRIPAREYPVLLLSVPHGDDQRFFFYDDVEKVVHECVSKKIDQQQDKGDDAHAPVSAERTEGVPEASPERQTEVLGDEGESGEEESASRQAA